jgi:hypothetical protein
VGLAQGAVGGLEAGASMVGELGKEALAWGASELGLNAAEHVVEHAGEPTPTADELPAEPDPYDAGLPEAGAE